MTTTHDLIIVGGGLVGASLAVGLKKSGMRIALIESFPFRQPGQPSYDDRTLALSAASCEFFKQIGLWDTLSSDATAIRQVHVSNRGFWGFTRISAEELGVDSMGHVVEARQIGGALLQHLDGQQGLELICPATAVSVSQADDYATVMIERDGQQSELVAPLVIAADGAQSRLRQFLNLPAQEHDYKQTAIVANVTPERYHEHRAFERFTDTGPLAILPHQGQRCGMVWITPADQVDELLAQSDDQFMQGLQRRFGYRLGRFKRLGRRSSYPLKLTWVDQQRAGRVLLIGNSAHAIHPVAAQGFNLGLRDVAALIALLTKAAEQGVDFGSDTVLSAYLAARKPDQEAIVRLTDGLARVFTNPSMLMSGMRNTAMLAMDLVPGLKRGLARRTMGFAATAPELDLSRTDSNP